jgi:hypothetical protein
MLVLADFENYFLRDLSDLPVEKLSLPPDTRACMEEINHIIDK